jgi:TRAP-type transport system periplasmic protein
MKRLIIAALAAVLPITALTAFDAKANKLTLLYAFPDNQTPVRVIAEGFVRNLGAIAGNKVRIERLGPDAFPPLEQFEPLQQGLVDMLYTHPAYHAGLTPIGITVDAIKADPDKFRSSGLLDLYDEHYKRFGVKVLMIAPLGETGFRFVSRRAVDGKDKSFSGMKVRATVSYIPVIQNMGGSPVNMPGGEVYSSLEKGVVDAAPWARTGILDWKWNEVTKFVVQPDFGVVYNWIFVNRSKWDSLNAETKGFLTAAAAKTEKEVLVEMEKLSIEELKKLQESGLKVTTMNANEASNIDKWWNEGLWGIANKSQAEWAKRISDRAREVGMTK